MHTNLQRLMGIVKTRHDPRHISSEQFNYILDAYDDFLPKTILHSLDHDRFRKIPSYVSSRKYLLKLELVQLGQWLYKRSLLARRSARDVNLKRLDSNDRRAVQDKTQKAFDIVSQQNINEQQGVHNSQDVFLKALEELKTLEGVGFSIAVLILSVAYPDQFPFVSSELYLWVIEDHFPQSGDNKKLEGYLELRTNLSNLIDRMAQRGNIITLEKAEKVAYVLHTLKGIRESYTDPKNIELVFPEHSFGNGGYCVGIFRGRGRVPPLNTHPFIAIKYLSRYEIRTTELLNEIRIITRLREKHQDLFVSFYGWTMNDGHYQLAMEEMAQDLESFLGERGTWKNKKSNITIEQATIRLLRGLKVMHDAGIAHRDLKPWNILLDQNQKLKIADFGVSKHARNHFSTTMLTAFETGGYTAPEIMKRPGVSYDMSADLWSIGCILFRMCQGYHLFISNLDTKKHASARIRKMITPKRTGLSSTSWELRLITGFLQIKPDRRKSIDQALKIMQPASSKKHLMSPEELVSDVRRSKRIKR